MEIFSKIHAQNLVRWAKDKPDAIVLSADLTNSTEIDLFKQTYPERFFSMGIAEQNMISFAGGLAREGFIPLVHTFAVFIYRRAYDQIVMSVAYPNLPVKFFGFLPGITTPGGATHQAIEDIAVMRAVPNMSVYECGDAEDVEAALDTAYKINGPVYVRMLRGNIPRLFNGSLSLNKARLLSTGSDIAVLSSGICTEEALKAVELLKNKGLSIQHLHITRLKPFADEIISDAIRNVKYGVITMENHTVVGGLGSAAADLMAEKGIGRKLLKVGLNDTFAHGAGTKYLMREYNIDAMALINKCEELTGKSFGISRNDLEKVERVSDSKINTAAKAEDL